MEFNRDIGKSFFRTQIGVVKNTGQGADLMAARYNQNLRNKPRDPQTVALEQQNARLREALRKQQRKG